MKTSWFWKDKESHRMRTENFTDSVFISNYAGTVPAGIVMKKVVLFILVVAMVCVNVSGIALTTTEKEQKYSNAILELETYLQSMVIDSISVALNGIKEEFDELGNYEYSRELYYYVSVLMNIELEDYSDWHTDVWLEQLCKDNRFITFTQDAGTIANAEILRSYYLGRKAEFFNDSASAINYYDQCIGYFDASDRQLSLRRYSFEDLYSTAEYLMNQGLYEEAYNTFVQCGSYNDADVYANYIRETFLKSGSQNNYGNYQSSNTSALNASKLAELDEKFAVNQYVKFGTYPQTSSGTDQTPIEWKVLARDGNKALLISRYGLDQKAYNTECVNITWETCTLRKWLNNEFLNAAFTLEQQNGIESVTVDNSQAQGQWSTYGGNNTEQDKVFLLSYAEAMKYFANDAERRCVPTAYAVSNGATQSSNFKLDGQKCCLWWLRSPGSSSYTAALVISSGSISGSRVNYWDNAVRPAIWVNLESGVF